MKAKLSWLLIVLWGIATVWMHPRADASIVVTNPPPTTVPALGTALKRDNGALGMDALFLRPSVDSYPSVETGDVWYSTDSQTFRARTAGGTYVYVFTHTASVTDSTTLANPTSRTAFSSKATLLANTYQAGKCFRLTGYGRYTGGIVASTWDFGVRIGGTDVATTGAIAAASGGPVNAGWSFDCDFRANAVGSSGSVVANVKCQVDGGSAIINQGLGRGSATLNTTVNRDVEVTVVCTSNVANAMTLETLVLELLN